MKDTFYRFSILYASGEELKSSEFYARNCDGIAEACFRAVQFARDMYGDNVRVVTFVGIEDPT